MSVYEYKQKLKNLAAQDIAGAENKGLALPPHLAHAKQILAELDLLTQNYSLGRLTRLEHQLRLAIIACIEEQNSRCIGFDNLSAVNVLFHHLLAEVVKTAQNIHYYRNHNVQVRVTHTNTLRCVTFGAQSDKIQIKALMCQGLDYTFGNSNGYCMGYIYAWAYGTHTGDELTAFGITEATARQETTESAPPFALTTETIALFQETSHDAATDLHFQRTGFRQFIDSAAGMAENILDTHHAAEINKVHIISLIYPSGRHAVGFKKNQLGQLEFMDANAGWFVFSDDDAFKDFWSRYHADCLREYYIYTIDALSFDPEEKTIKGFLQNLIYGSRNPWQDLTTGLIGAALSDIAMLALIGVLSVSPPLAIAILCAGITLWLSPAGGISGLWHGLRAIARGIYNTIADCFVDHEATDESTKPTKIYCTLPLPKPEAVDVPKNHEQEKTRKKHFGAEYLHLYRNRLCASSHFNTQELEALEAGSMSLESVNPFAEKEPNSRTAEVFRKTCLVC